MTRKQAKKHRRKAGHKSQDHKPKPPKQVGLFVTKELTTAIEACREKVERIARECRAKNKKFRDQEFDLEFDTFRCLHGYTEWTDCRNKDVQRVTEIYDDPHFFPAGGAASSNAIRQGKLGDCYFLSALATVSCVPSLIEKICVARDEQVGVYGFIFYRDNGWVSIVIDDLLFTNIPKFEELDNRAKVTYHEDKDRYNAIARKGGHVLLYAGAGSQDETWVPLIEKAYAKLYGNFAHIDGGFTHESVEDLTGGVSTVFVTRDILDTDQFWEDDLQNANKDRVFACGFNSLDAPEDDPYGASPTVQGLFGNHAYSVLKAVECNGKRFVVVRNPWGKGEWTGRWSDGSKEWTPEWLKILPQLGHTFGDDGQFVMEYPDFLRCFDTIERTFLFDDSWLVASSWLSVPLSDQPRAWSYGTLSYIVTVPAKTKTILVLSRLNDRFFRSIVKSAKVTIDFAVVKLGELVPMETVSESRPFMSRSVSLELDLDAGTYIVYVRMDRERMTGGPMFTVLGHDDESDSDDDDDSGIDVRPPGPVTIVNTSTRVISRILTSKVECQSIAENWDNKLKSQFTVQSLQQTIAEDLQEIRALLDQRSPEGDAENAKEGSVNGETAEEPGDNDNRPMDADGNEGDEGEGHEKEVLLSQSGLDNLTVADAPSSSNGNINSYGILSTPGHPQPSSPNSTTEWDIILKLFVIGVLNIIALFGLSLIKALDPKPKSASDAPKGQVREAGGEESDNETGDDEEDEIGSDSSIDQVLPGWSASKPPESWRDLLTDEGTSIILGLRVYTQTKEPALVTGRIKSANTCSCPNCRN